MNSDMKSVWCMDYAVYADRLDKIQPNGPKILINTLNQYSYCIAKNDLQFKQSLSGSDILLPDGIAIVVAAKFLSDKKIEKIAGADIHKHLLTRCNQLGNSCFYLGASELTLAKIKERVNLEYPAINVGTYSPPYKKSFTEEDSRQMIEAVNKFKPNVVFVGMTAPKQEKWAFEFKNDLDVNVICSIGAVFDFYASTVERPSDFWIKIGLEWFIRLIKEPRRLWKRYLYFGPLFIWDVMKRKLHSKG